MVLAALGFTARATADPPPIAYNLHYEALSLGFVIMQMDASIHLLPRGYDVVLNYHTTGLAHLLYSGHQSDQVTGVWVDNRAAPLQFLGGGEWRGKPRRTDILYHNGQPDILELLPPITEERQPVPPSLQRDTEDTLSALAQLLHQIERNGSCNTAARIFDGRRLSEIVASTAGLQPLARSHNAIFTGTALRCDFVGRMLGGFKLDRQDIGAGRPRRGSAWFASLQPGMPALPVRMEFGTDWFGSVTMVLTGATPQTPNFTQAASSAQ
jgi:hypothetical protein